MKKIGILLLICICLYTNVFSQCTGGTSAGLLTPSTIFQTTSVKNGQYFTINVSMCDNYTFSFCQGGGSGTWDTQITILDGIGSTSLGFNDDYCSLQSEITWTAPFSGTIRVLISKYSCVNDLTSTATLAYVKVPSTGDYCLYENANNQVIGGTNCIELTQAVNDETGCAWNQTPTDFSQPFMLTLDYYFGNSYTGADGTTFTFLPNPTGCGINGDQLGAGGLPNALTVEFDTYDNDSPAEIWDIPADHIAVDINGIMPSSPLCGPVPAISSGADIDDGVTHNVQIIWDPVSMNLSIYFDGNLRLTCTYDFINNVFGGQTQIYWGATAATGGLNNEQYFCPNTVVLPVELTEFKTTCVDQNNRIEWTSGSEHRLAYYLLEYTYDGYVFYTLNKTNAHGDSDIPLSYQYTDHTAWQQQAYYRLTSVDLDGKKESSKLITALQCLKKENQLIGNFKFNNGAIELQFASSKVYYQLFDLSGKALTEVLSSGEDKAINLNLNLAKGIYLLKAWNTERNIIENYKISAE